MSHDPLQCGDYLQLCIKTRLDRRPRVITAPPLPPPPLSCFSFSVSLSRPAEWEELPPDRISNAGEFPASGFFGCARGRRALLSESLRLLASRPACTVVHGSARWPSLPWLLFFFYRCSPAGGDGHFGKQIRSRCHVTDI